MSRSLVTLLAASLLSVACGEGARHEQTGPRAGPASQHPLGLDHAASGALLRARPIATARGLSTLAFVGTPTAQKVRAGAARPALQRRRGEDLFASIETAATGLWHTSESDYPLVAVLVPGAGATPLSAADFKDRIAPAYVARPGDVPLADRDVEVVPLSAFFDRYTQPQGWWEQGQLDAVPAWLALEAILRDRVTDAQLFRVGFRYRSEGYVAPTLSGSIDLFVVGRSSDGAIVGFSTVGVET